MKRVLTILLVFIGLLGFVSSPLAQESLEQKQQAAIAAAESFLALVDDGRYAQSWQDASAFFKSQVPEEQWVSQVSRLRPAFGKVLSRTLKSVQYRTQVPGAPDGEYFLIIFASSFEKKRNTFESITPALDADGLWHVAGYYLK